MYISSKLQSKAIALCDSIGIKDRERIVDNLERLWLPLASELATARQGLERSLISGILGGQGTGKSTLCKILKLILNDWGISVATLSIDDLYLTYEERQALLAQDHRLIWRGPPGTHDVQLGLEIIRRCLDDDPLGDPEVNPTTNPTVNITFPRFDKSKYGGAGDRIDPIIIPKPDILLFEGWFVGVRPIEESFFVNPPTPIITSEDKQFAKNCNQRLQTYVPLWDKLDSLVVLYPEDYRLSMQWRKDAEHQMIATGKTGMSDEEIDRFVEYFWKALHPELFIKPLTTTADLVVEIKCDRSLGGIYRNR